MTKQNNLLKEVFLAFQVDTMETTIKDELDHLLDIVKAAQQACYNHGAVGVINNIKIHSKTTQVTDTFCTYDRGVTPANHMFVQ